MSRELCADFAAVAESYLCSAIELQKLIDHAVKIDSGLVTYYFLQAATYYEKAEWRTHAARCRNMSSCYSKVGSYAYSSNIFPVGFEHQELFAQAEWLCNKLHIENFQQRWQLREPPLPSYKKQVPVVRVNDPYANTLFSPASSCGRPLMRAAPELPQRPTAAFPSAK